MEGIKIHLKVNGQDISREVDPRLLLSDFIRENLLLTGTHIGCEHGVCGACTIQVNGDPVRSCLMLAVQADGCEVKTVESLIQENGELSHLQQAFSDNHALQCGFCTPGFLITLSSFLEENSNPDEEEIRKCISGNLCRCTGYSNIIKAVKQAAQKVSN
ncbi:(2Fe-2S)-binding protein [Peribacillus sp. NJ11]|uniref:(2Fe-2S)-binding protein n=1 Tax=Peribacillus TaxID=2675229 RepID=UPI0025A1B7D7|nr:(2Fe-2S)-binding protein [Peribacillus sp. NJ11]MDM5223105.1 (2Fe-2S)-binding protein [Peribacillus sp. NJ11]